MRTRTLLTVAVLTVAALTLAFAGVAGAGGDTTTVRLGDNFFQPDSKKVAKGTKIRFKWTGEEEHNVTKKRGPGRSFASETTSATGVNFKRTFRKRGTYRLICTVHPDDMKLKVEVG
jgi:plastocyanin